MKGLGIFCKKMKQYFQNNILDQNFEEKYLLTTFIGYFVYQVRGVDILYKKVKQYLKK